MKASRNPRRRPSGAPAAGRRPFGADGAACSGEEGTTRIVPFRTEFRQAFEALNLAWLNEYSLLEEEDLKDLRDPEARILSAGGQVFFATENGEAVGTCAAIRQSPTAVELAKLAVDEKARGRGLGRRLSEAVIEYARNLGAERVVLTSNTALATAIGLYESMGFQHRPMPADVRYRTANVFMVLEI